MMRSSTHTGGKRQVRTLNISRTVGVLAVTILVGLGSLVGAAAADYFRQASSDNPVAIRGCSVAFDQRSGRVAAPRLVADEQHYCVGTTSVSVDAEGDLILRAPSLGPIISLDVTVDETLARKGIACGASGGLGVTEVRCYDRENNHLRTDAPEVFNRHNTLWITWFTWQED
ncbi:hypothetical protein ACQCX2_09475 [Propionibacteriaceae bacterium Y1700]|uniref:hypothetical protein n=1 Tax=Microlunatus sp. Y1700 TaxID=3418487 RepID=UPI003DA71D34